MTVPDSTSSKLDELNWAEWVAKNGRKAAIGTGFVVLLVAAVFLYRTSQIRKESFASQELTQARNSAESGNLPLAAADLSKIMERFGGTKAADEAAILLNQIRMLQGQRDVAVNALQQFVRGRHPDYVEASAYALLAAGLEEQGKAKDAGEAYRQASAKARLDFQQAQYLLDAGRVFAVAGDSTAAKAAYNEVLTKFGRIDQAAEARVRMAELGGTVPPPPAPEDTSATS
jgi:predicted negative regulator of RcsB-dependent stress response